MKPETWVNALPDVLRDPMPTVAVIGAGASGLICARTLADHGLRVTVLEKSRGVGGRMATRRTSAGIRFDHGAQYFTVRDRRFQQYVDSWIQGGIVRPWAGRLVAIEISKTVEEKSGRDRFVGVPGMNAICKYLAVELDVCFRTPAAPPRHIKGGWQLSTVNGKDFGVFDIVVVSSPASQAAELLQDAPGLAEQARSVPMHECWAVLVAFPQSLGLGFDGAFINQSPLSWVARISSKPGRSNEPETWVLHASPQWTRGHINQSAEDVKKDLLAEFWQNVGLSPHSPQFSSAHLWRFAQPSEPLSDACLFDTGLRVGACGDWCGGPRVEGAFLSGLAAAERVIRVFGLTYDSGEFKEA